MTTIADTVRAYVRTHVTRPRQHGKADLTEPKHRAVEELAADVIRDVTRDRDCPTVPCWEVGATETGLPVISGRISVPHPHDAQRKLTVYAQFRGWSMRVDDPARIAIEGLWPEDGPPRAVVELWAPAPSAP